MQTPSMAVSTTFYYPIPKTFILSPSPTKRNPNSLRCSTNPICSPSHSSSPSSSSISLQTTNNRIQNQTLRLPPFEDSFLFYQFSSPTEDPRFSNQIPEEIREDPHELVFQSLENNNVGISSNMWWADLKAAIGQRINVEGIVSSISVVVKDRNLVLPHVSVKDIRYIDWEELKRKGFKGVVFDKDNTLTAPYSLAIWPPLRSSIDRCKAVFGHDIAVFSNSAGKF